jgi:hypothetical protein
MTRICNFEAAVDSGLVNHYIDEPAESLQRRDPATCPLAGSGIHKSLCHSTGTVLWYH